MPHSQEDDGGPCSVSRATTLAPMIEKYVEVKKLVLAIYIVKTHENLIKRYQALVAQGIAEIAPRVLQRIKVASLSLSYAHTPEVMKVPKCIAAPHTWFRSMSKDRKTDRVNAVRIYKAFQTKERILKRHYGTKQQDATLQEIIE